MNLCGWEEIKNRFAYTQPACTCTGRALCISREAVGVWRWWGSENRAQVTWVSALGLIKDAH